MVLIQSSYAAFSELRGSQLKGVLKDVNAGSAGADRCLRTKRAPA